MTLHGQTGFVHTKGAELLDESGKPLMLRGTNLGNWMEPEGYMFHLGDGAQVLLADDLDVVTLVDDVGVADHAHHWLAHGRRRYRILPPAP